MVTKDHAFKQISFKYEENSQPRFKKESMIEIEDSSNEKDVQSKKIKGMISQSLENIEENVKSIPDLPVRKFVERVKRFFQS